MSDSSTPYDPVQHGVSRDASSVSYVEVEPPAELTRVAHKFWELRTIAPINDDFWFHVLPDASKHIAFNFRVARAAGMTAVDARSVRLHLGAEFHFVGVRLRPGVWRGHGEITPAVISRAYEGDLPFAETWLRITDTDLNGAAPLLSELVGGLLDDKLIVENPITDAICAHAGTLRSVADMAKLVGLSCRQLQRVLTQSTGFQPHDLLKILRLHHSFRDHYLTHYADQSHFTRCFRDITGYTPTRYQRVFNV